jgi:hypothetical protein
MLRGGMSDEKWAIAINDNVYAKVDGSCGRE